MANKLNDRVLEAKAIASLGKVEKQSAGRVSVVVVPASAGTLNQVIIRRHSGAVITTECRKIAGHKGYENCKGNLSGFCRHSLAAIIMAMEEAGYKPLFRSKLEDAEKLADRKRSITFDIDGKPVVFVLRSWQSDKAKPLYMVAIDITAEELS